jgi:hypothetical protein
LLPGFHFNIENLCPAFGTAALSLCMETQNKRKKKKWDDDGPLPSS